MTAPAVILRAARGYIAEPERWTKGRLARYPAPDRVARCAIGAVFAAACTHEGGFGSAAHEAADALLGVVGGTCISTWNDAPERTHAEVLEAFDRAIAAAEAAEPVSS